MCFVERSHREPRFPTRSVTRRVLVVDDNADARDVLAQFIQLSGHQVRTACDGLEALKLAPSFRPQVIFLDIGMPALDGYEVCSRLRTMPSTADAAIYALTGFGSDEHRNRASRAGFDAHFLKPLDPNVVIELLRR